MDLYVGVKRNRFETIILQLGLVFYISYTLMPIFPRLVTFKQSTFIIILLFVFLLLNSIKNIKDGFSKEKLLLFIPFVLLIVLEIIFLCIYSNSFTYDLYDLFLINLPVFMFFLILNDEDLVKAVALTGFLVIVITCVTSTTYLIGDTQAARWLASAGDSNDPYFITLNLSNVGGFESVYSIAILVPFIIGLFKVRKIDWKLFVVLIALIVLNIYFAKYAMASVFTVLGLMTIFLPRIKSLKKLFLILVGGFLALLIFRHQIANFMYYISGFIKNIDISNKMKVIGDFLNGIENTTSYNTRLPLIKESFQMIKENFWIGTTLTKEGANSKHSFILDTITKFGVIGIIAVLSIYLSIFVLLYKKFKDDKLYVYIVLSCLIAILASFLNPGAWYFIILLIIPAFAICFKNRSLGRSE